MYLDTDIILALIKEEDWLKKYVSFSKLKDPKTSVLTIIESRIVLLREYDRGMALSCLSKLENLNLIILPLDKTILEKSQNLMVEYKQLNVFDAIHVASAIIHNETIISTDHIFSSVDKLKHIDPRYL